MTTVATIFLPINAQNCYSAIVRTVFICSVILHCISLSFLAKYTPPKLFAWRRYMLFVQMILIAIDVHMEILVQPIVLFPAPAAFTTGHLCRLGLPILIQGGIAVLLIGNIGSAIFLCVLHRHQSILISESSRFKLSRRANRSVCVVLIVAHSVPSIIFSAVPQNPKKQVRLIEDDPRNISWITERGCFYYGKREHMLEIYSGLASIIIASATCIMFFLFLHINYLLTKDNGKRSDRSILNIRKSVKILFLQLFTPLLFMEIPATIVFAATAFDSLLSFEQCLAVFSTMYLHSLVHNIFLLSLTPAYRKKIVFLMKFIGNCSHSQKMDSRICEVRSIGKVLKN